MTVLQRVVGGTGLWWIAAIPPDQHAMGLVNQTQVQCVMWMMRRGRRAGETWLEHHIRTSREARAVVHGYSEGRWSTIWLSRLWKYHGHVARGLCRQVPLASSLVNAWRDLSWWQSQQNKPDGVRRPARFFPRLTQLEKKLDSAAQGRWRDVAQDRALWREGEQRFVQQMDLPGHRADN